MKPLTDEQRALVEDNMKLVPYMLKRFDVPYQKMISDEDDLMQIGYLALCMAAIAYDAAYGKFSTYACAAIKNAIIKQIDKETNVSELSVEDEATLDYLSEHNPSNVEEAYETKYFLEKIAERRNVPCAEGRKIQMLFFFMDGYTTKEISKANGLSLAWVQHSIQHARKYVKMEYQKYERELLRA